MEVKKITKTQEALRIELEDLKNLVYNLDENFGKKLSRERIRLDRVVQVLLNNLPESQLMSKVTFFGMDSDRDFRDWGSGEGYTLKDFLLYVIDP